MNATTGAKMIPTVILACHTAGLGVIRALGTMRIPIVVFYYDKDDMGYVSKYVRRKFHVPSPEQSPEQFVQRLIEYAAGSGRCLLVPTDDETLAAVSKNKEELSKYYEVACAGWGITEKIINKNYTYGLAEKAGIPVPRTFLPKSQVELDSYAELTGYPCLIKPCRSHQYYKRFKRKMVMITDSKQLREAFAEARDAGLEVMLQEYIPGDVSNNANYNSYFWGNKPLAEFTAAKIRISPTEFGVPCVVKSKYIPEIMASGRKLLTALGYYGYSCTEFKMDPRDGTYKLMEINGRHNRSTLLSVHCGLNFPWLEYKHRILGELPGQDNFNEGVYWIDDVKDIVLFMAGARRNLRCLNQYLRPYREKFTFSVLDKNDILPFCKRLADLSARSLKTILAAS